MTQIVQDESYPTFSSEMQRQKLKKTNYHRALLSVSTSSEQSVFQKNKGCITTRQIIVGSRKPVWFFSLCLQSAGIVSFYFPWLKHSNREVETYHAIIAQTIQKCTCHLYREANQSLNKLGRHQIPGSFGQAVGSRKTAKQQNPGQGEIAASLNLTYSGY